MYTQRRLMEEQIRLWSACPLGRKLLAGKHPETLEDFLAQLPLTSYADYADTLLARRDDMLCAEPAIWIQTTWEGGLRPIKLAPYSRGMLNTYRHNLMAAMMLGTARRTGDFDLKSGDRILYGGAPLPWTSSSASAASQTTSPRPSAGAAAPAGITASPWATPSATSGAST